MDRWTRREWLARSVGAAGAAAAIVSSQLGATVDDGAPAAEKGGETADMVLIPGGPFLMGTTREEAEALGREHGYHPSWLGGEVPRRSVAVATFLIDRLPVTNERYALFVKATDHRPPVHWGGKEPPRDLLAHPVVLVDKADAEAYASWAGKRLPTEAEWEKAARGPDGRRFPWGDEFDPEACHFDRGAPTGRGLSSLPQHLAESLGKSALWLPSGTASATAHPKGASPYGVLDLVGNAAEWCADSPGPGSAFIKGGCWLSASPVNLRPAARNMSGFANNRLAFVGFRCANEVGR